MAADTQISFGPFRLDLEANQLCQGEEAIALQPRPLAVLCYLVERPGEIISRDELLREVWGETYVSKSAIKVSMRALRSALGDRADEPQYIETVGWDGYRFIAPVSSAAHSASTEYRGKSAPAPLSSVVGREAELGVLDGYFERVLQGERQLIFVTGEAGTGKTTLIDQFMGQAATGGRVRLGWGQCSEQYGEGEAYLPVLEAMGRLCREPSGTALVDILRRHAPTWLAQMPSVVDEQEFETLSRQAHGATRERMLREMAEAIEALSAQRSLILVFEDLHWSDVSTLDLLAYLARRREPAHLLILGTYRPTEVIVQEHPLQEVVQELRSKGQCQELALENLTRGAVEVYLAERLESVTIHPQVVDIVYQRTGGNALFMANVVEHLLAQDVLKQEGGQWKLRGAFEEVAASIPDGLRQLIERQITRMPKGPQRVLEGASVVGVEFATEAVAAGVRTDLDELEDAYEELARQGQVLEQAGLAEWTDGTLSGQYRFQHALYQQAFYERIAEARRVRLHRAIGERLEKGYGDRAKDHASELAVHFELGREGEKAVHYHQHAGGIALRRSAHQEALYHINKGLELLQKLPESPERNQQELLFYVDLGVALAETKGFAAPDVEQAYLRARALSQQLEDVSILFPILYGLWNFYLVLTDLKTAQELADQMFALAEKEATSAFLLEAHNVQAQTKFQLGNIVQAHQHLEQGIQIYTPQEHHALTFSYGEDPGIGVRVFAAEALWILGYPDKAQEQVVDAHRLAHELDHPFSLAQALWFGSQVHLWRGEADLVYDESQTLLALCRTQDFALWLAGGLIMSGWALATKGQIEEGMSQLTEGLTAWRSSGARVMTSCFLVLQAEAYAKAGRVSDGFSSLDAAFEQIHKADERYYEAEVYRLKGELLVQGSKPVLSPSTPLRTGAVDGPNVQSSVEECFHKALAIARQQEARSLELRAAMNLSQLWQDQGKTQEAHALLSEVYNWFTEGFGTKDLQDAKVLLDALS